MASDLSGMNLTTDTVREAFRNARRDAGLSQRKLADEADVSRATIDRFERGASWPTVDTFVKLVGAIGAGLFVAHLLRQAGVGGQVAGAIGGVVAGKAVSDVLAKSGGRMPK
jgi:transcriptional regulator with XRE-family HTH domain